MKNKDFIYHCSIFPPLLIAVLLIALPQLAKSASTATLTNKLSSKLDNKQFHTLSTYPLYVDLNKTGDAPLQHYSDYYSLKMIAAAPMLKAAVLKHEESGLGQRYTQHHSLQKCQFTAADIELDQRKVTREWLVSTSKHCDTKTLAPNLWLLQSKARQLPRILMSERANTLKISQVLKHDYRTVNTGLNTRLVINNKIHEANCRKRWRYDNQSKTYDSDRENIKIWGQPALSKTPYWHKINHVYPDLKEQLPVECPRY